MVELVVGEVETLGIGGALVLTSVHVRDVWYDTVGVATVSVHVVP